MNEVGSNSKSARHYHRHKSHYDDLRKLYRANNPEKVRAHWSVGYAIRTGKITRPHSCSVCLKICVPQAHHKDYSKPLEIVWLCRACHKIAHFEKIPRPLESPRGEKIGTSKLTAGKVIRIKKDITRSIRGLARDFGVCHETIRLIKNGETWKHL